MIQKQEINSIKEEFGIFKMGFNGEINQFKLSHATKFPSYQEGIKYMMDNTEKFDKNHFYSILPIIKFNS